MKHRNITRSKKCATEIADDDATSQEKGRGKMNNKSSCIKYTRTNKMKLLQEFFNKLVKKHINDLFT